MKLTIHLHLVLRLRMSGATPPPICLDGVDSGNFTFILPFTQYLQCHVHTDTQWNLHLMLFDKWFSSFSIQFQWYQVSSCSVHFQFSAQNHCSSQKPYMQILLYLLLLVGRDSSVGIAISYELNGPGIKSRWGQDLRHLSRLALGPTQPPVQWVPAHFQG